MTRIFRTWLAALAACAAFCAASISWADRPIVEYFSRHHLAWQMPYEFPIYLAAGLVPLGAGAILICALARLNRRPPPRFAQALMLAGFAVLGGLAVTFLALKPGFGRSDINDYFAAIPRYGFIFFGGDWNSSFPSGHAVIIAAFLTVFWVFYPRLKPLYAIAAAAVLLCLMAARWHFLSDIVAGAFVGWTAGLITLAVAGSLSRRRRDAPGLWR